MANANNPDSKFVFQAAAIQDEHSDIHRIPYHLIHDAYHLGRITQLRAMRGGPDTRPVLAVSGFGSMETRGMIEVARLTHK